MPGLLDMFLGMFGKGNDAAGGWNEKLPGPVDPKDIIGVVNAASQRDLPIYSENRRTQAPMVYNQIPIQNGYQIYGETWPAGTKADDDLLDRYLGPLLMKYRSNPDAMNMMSQAIAGNQRGMIGIDPTAPMPIADTIQHESIHNLLDQGGFKDRALESMHRSGIGRKVMQQVAGSDRDLDAGAANETPAYMGSYRPGETPVNSDLRDLYMKWFTDAVGKKNPKLARQIQAIATPGRGHGVGVNLDKQNPTEAHPTN